MHASHNKLQIYNVSAKSMLLIPDTMTNNYSELTRVQSRFQEMTPHQYLGQSLSVEAQAPSAKVHCIYIYRVDRISSVEK